MQPSEVKPKMISVEPAVLSLQTDGESRLPKAVGSFLWFLLSRLENFLRVKFFMYSSPTEPAEVLKVKKKIHYLKSVGIVKNFWRVKRQILDEPHVPAVEVELVRSPNWGISGYGRALYEQNEAWGPAYGEALERWCVDNFSPAENQRIILTTKELKNSSTQFDLYSIPSMDRDREVIEGHKSVYKISDDSKFVCVYVDELTSGGKHPFPLQGFSFQYARQFVNTGKEPKIQPVITTGAATGRSKTEAVLSGIYECLERDAFSLYWLRSITPNRLPLDFANSNDAQRISEISDRYKFECYFLYLKTDFSVHTVLCVILDRTDVGPAVVVDASAGTDIAECIRKSFLGALGQRVYMRDRWSKKSNQDISVEKLTLTSRVFWWYEAEKLTHLDFLLKGPVIDEIPNYSLDSMDLELDRILKEFKAKEFKVFCADLLPSWLAKNVEEKVVFIKIPDLIPMHVTEREKIVAGQRLFNLPQKLGLNTGTQEINPLPHPFS